MDQEINRNVCASMKAFCKDGVVSGRCMPDGCDFCPAQQLLEMLDNMETVEDVKN